MSDPEQIKADIELTRAELAQTVDALHAKLDVRAQAKKHVSEISARARRVAEDNQRVLLMMAGAVLVLLTVRKMRHRES